MGSPVPPLPVAEPHSASEITWLANSRRAPPDGVRPGRVCQREKPRLSVSVPVSGVGMLYGSVQISARVSVKLCRTFGSRTQMMSLPSLRSPPLSIEPRVALPLLASARREAFGVRCELMIEVHLDMLVRMGLWGVEHGSNSLRTFGHSRRSSSSLPARTRKSPVPSSFDFSRYARRWPRCGGSVVVSLRRGPFPNGLGPRPRRIEQQFFLDRIQF